MHQCYTSGNAWHVSDPVPFQLASCTCQLGLFCFVCTHCIQGTRTWLCRQQTSFERRPKPHLSQNGYGRIYIYIYIYTYIHISTTTLARQRVFFFFSVFPSAWFPTWCHLEPSWANLEARWANLELTWAKLRQHGAHLGPNNANNRSFKNVKKKGFLCFFEVREPSRGSQLDQLAPRLGQLESPWAHS